METQPGRSRTGLILGKFLPPHRGHLHLVEHALRRVEELTILVCSLPNEPIPGALRAEWMRELCPGARVLHVTDENPSFPGEHPDFWEIWVRSIRRLVPTGPDVVFTSEDYGDELARRLGARHELVDPGRRTVPVSGSILRRDPLAGWEFLPDCVRPFFVRRIVVTGSECTGKTTLAEALAAHYRTVWVPEYGREFVAGKGAPVEASDVPAIARGQIASEDALARRANRVLVQDTDLLSTIVYSRHYFGDCPSFVEEALEKRRPDLYLLADIDVPWVPEADQRDRGDRREEMQELFRDALRSRNLPFIDIRGTKDARLEAAVRAVDQVLSLAGSRKSDV